MPEQQGGSRAAAWLLAEFDATDPVDITDVYDPETDSWSRPIHVQPMFRLKNAMETGQPMRVRASDYRDIGRWWL